MVAAFPREQGLRRSLYRSTTFGDGRTVIDLTEEDPVPERVTSANLQDGESVQTEPTVWNEEVGFEEGFEDKLQRLEYMLDSTLQLAHEIVIMIRNLRAVVQDGEV